MPVWGVAAAVVSACWLGRGWPLLLCCLLIICCLAVPRWRRWLTILVALGLAYGYGLWHLQQGLEARLPSDLHGQSLTFQARVSAIPVTETVSRFGRDQQRQRLQLQVWGNPQWPGQHRIQVQSYLAERLHAGDRVTITVRLQRPRARYNQGDSDWQRLWLANGVAARGRLENVADLQSGKGLLVWRAQRAERLRQQVALSGHGAQVLPALVVGDRSAMDRSLWSLFQHSGTAHLLAISGLHVAIVAGWVWGLARWGLLPLLLPLLLPGMPGLRRFALQQLAWGPALLAAGGYAALAGFSLPTTRALLMLTLVALAQCWPRPLTLSRSLAMALLIVLLLDPLSALGVSLWLSFSAVAFIALFARQYPSRALLVLLPVLMGGVSVLLFDQWTLISPLANLLLVPLYTLCVIPLALIGSITDSDWILLLAALGVDSSVQLMSHLLDWQGQWQGKPPGSMAGLLALLTLLLLLLPGWPLPRRLLPFLLLPWLLQRPLPLPEGGMEVVAFDVGQGLAVAVRTRRHLLLYDTGPGWGDGNVAEQSIVPWLRSYGLQPDLLMVSHGDSDHAGGVSAFPGIPRLSGEPLRVADSTPCQQGQHWQWDGVSFAVLWPPPGGQWQGNNASCVVEVRSSYGSLLLTGDVEREVEYRVLPLINPVDLLLIPHHGSDSSTTAALLARSEPHWALASLGYRNRFAHPSEQVLERLATAGVTVLRTDHHGMIVFRWGGTDNDPLITTWRQHHARPWHGDGQWRWW